MTYFADIKQRTDEKHWKMKRQFNTIANWGSQQMRRHFLRWKDQASLHRCVEEVNEIGPNVEIVLDRQIDMHNIRRFMEDEGYTDL